MSFLKQKIEKKILNADPLVIAIKRTRKNIQEALELESLFIEKEYLDDEEINSAFSLIKNFQEEIESDVYTSIVYGLKTTIKQIEEERDKTVTLRPLEGAYSFSAGYIPDNIRKQGFTVLLKRIVFTTGSSELEVYGKDEKSKKVYTDRIETIQTLHHMLEDGEGHISQIKERLLEIDMRISGALQIIQNMHSLIKKGQDPRSMSIRSSLSKYFEPLELEE